MEIKDLMVQVDRKNGIVKVEAHIIGKYVSGYQSVSSGYISFFPDECCICWKGKNTTDFWKAWPVYESKIKANREQYFVLCNEAKEIERALKYKLSELA